MDSSRVSTRVAPPWKMLCGVGALLLGSICGNAVCRADVTPESPEVKALIKSGLERAASEPEARLGGKCLVAIALLKLDQGDHPRVREALDECRAQMQRNRAIDIYSNGLALIFLSELGPRRHLTEMQYYLGRLMDAQKPHGGWGYDTQSTGDTSQTQYAALALWEANRKGTRIDADAVARLADWLLRTQDPGGAWGYQGQFGPSDRSTPQIAITPTMLAAGLGSVLICADMLGAMPKFGGPGEVDITFEVPKALRSARDQAFTPVLRSTKLNVQRLAPAIEIGNRWMDEHYDIDAAKYDNYYLYALERYKSFQELHDGISLASPQWYQEGYEFLKEHQLEGGGWTSGCGTAVDSAFGVLFLYRSTQKTIRSSLGEGSLTAGRGLPANVANATMRQGQIVVQKVTTELDQMLSLVDEEQGERLDQLAASGVEFDVDELDERSARRLEQLARAPEPAKRLLAVRALGRSGDLDYVPTLIYALTDPDRSIVIEARNGLRFVSRRFEGFGLPTTFDEKQRHDSIERWKEWYLTIRPEAVFER